MEEAAAELTARGVPFRADLPLGVMIETPAAAVVAKSFGKDVSLLQHWHERPRAIHAGRRSRQRQPRVALHATAPIGAAPHPHDHRRGQGGGPRRECVRRDGIRSAHGVRPHRPWTPCSQRRAAVGRARQARDLRHHVRRRRRKRPATHWKPRRPRWRSRTFADGFVAALGESPLAWVARPRVAG